MLSRHPVIALNIAKYMMEQREEALSTVEDLCSLKVPDRLVHLFERLAVDHGVAASDGTRVEVRLTHAQIASLVGSTRETVTLELSKLVRAGRLRTDGSYYVVPGTLASA